jgi:hypothetical protein
LDLLLKRSEPSVKIRFNDPDLKVTSLAVRFLRDGKVIAKLGDENFHYTLHPGHDSGVVDLHKTDERFSLSDPRRYETVGALAKDAIVAEIGAIGPSPIIELMNLWRPLRLGWMIRRRLRIGARLPTDVEVDGISVKRGPPDCNEPLASWIKPPEFYEDVLMHPNAAFLLFDCKKPSPFPYGAMITYRDQRGFVQMRWVRIRDLNRWVAKWEPVFLAAWARLRGRSHGLKNGFVAPFSVEDTHGR